MATGWPGFATADRPAWTTARLALFPEGDNLVGISRQHRYRGVYHVRATRGGEKYASPPAEALVE